MSTNQPEWKLVAQLGDAHPIDHGGYFIFVDQTGVYEPEGEKIFPIPDDKDQEILHWEVRRFTLEPCTYIDGILSDNKYHPGKPAWFAKTEEQRLDRPQDTTYLKNLSDSVGVTVDELADMFCSEDITERARAWEIVGDYHGYDNLDPYPLNCNRQEIEARVAWYKQNKTTDLSKLEAEGERLAAEDRAREEEAAEVERRAEEAEEKDV